MFNEINNNCPMELQLLSVSSGIEQIEERNFMSFDTVIRKREKENAVPLLYSPPPLLKGDSVIFTSHKQRRRDYKIKTLLT